MPILKLTYEETKALGLTEIYPSSSSLHGGAASSALNHLVSQGFPDLAVYLCQAGSTAPGTLVGHTIVVFAMQNMVVDVAATLTHEYGHIVWDWIASERETYIAAKWDTRVNIPPGRMDEVFAEDFRQLFGSAEARRRPHKYDSAEEAWQGLGYALPDVIQNLQGWPERRERLKRMVVDAIKQSQAPEPTKPGASVFSDIAGHWAEVDIVAAAEAGILKGDPDGKFRPEDKVTRAELATVVARLLRQK